MFPGDQENKRSRLEPPPVPHLSATPTPVPHQLPAPGQLATAANGPPQAPMLPSGGVRGNLTIINKELPPEQFRPRILLSCFKNKEVIERVSTENVCLPAS